MSFRIFHSGFLFAALISSAAVFGAASVKPEGILDITSTDRNRVSTTTPDAFLDNGKIFAYNVFDNVIDNDSHRIITKKNTSPVDVIYDFGRPTRVDSYQISFYVIATTYAGRAPKVWQFQGSNDGENWTTLDSQDNETDWAIEESRFYMISNPGSYSKYRFYVTSNGAPDEGSGDSYIQFAELEFYDTTILDLTDDNPERVSSTIGTFVENCGPENLFDNVFTGMTHRVLSAKDCKNFDVIYTFENPTKVNTYRIFLGAVDLLNRAPKTWTFEGSENSGLTWTVLDVRSSETNWSKDEVRTYAFNNDVAYTSYRLHITNNNGNNNGDYVQFWELEFINDPNVEYISFSPADFDKSYVADVGGYVGDETLYNFPVLVRLSTSIPGFSYGDFALANGGDLCFATMDNRLLDHEIDTWNEDGESLVWVRIPELTKGYRFRVCYGNSELPPRYGVSVWTSYAGVWHLNGEYDSSLKGSSITKVDTVYDVASSLIGKGCSTPAYGCLKVVPSPLAQLTSLSNCTVSAWFKPAANTDTARLFSNKNNAAAAGMEFIYAASTYNGLWLRGASNAKTLQVNGVADTAFATNTWSHLAATWDISTGKIYHNGTCIGTGDIDPLNAYTQQLFIGGWAGEFNRFNGEVDEIRVFNGVATPARIKAEYDSINNANFLSISQSRKSGVVIIYR